MKRILSIAACAVASVVLSACGSSGPTAAPHYRGADSLTFVADGPSTAVGVDNTDLFAAAPNGMVRDVTSTAAAETDAGWSADGRHVVFIRHWTTGQPSGQFAVHVGVFVWSPGHGAPRQIAACSTYCEQQEFAWSPDDSQIAFLAMGKTSGIELMDADGRNVHMICGAGQCDSGPGTLAWSPDGQRLVFSTENTMVIGPFDPPSAIWVANADGSGVRKLTQPGCDLARQQRKGCAIDGTPTWSPDSSQIAFSRRPDQFVSPRSVGEKLEPTKLEVMSVDGAHLRTLASCHGDLCSQRLQTAWSPTGKAIAWVKNGGADPGIQLTTLAGKTTALRTCAGSSCVDPLYPTWSPDGKRLAFFVSQGRTVEIWTIGRDGSSLRRVAGNADWCCLAWIARAALPGRTPTTPNTTLPHLSGTVAFASDSSSSPSATPYSDINLLSLGNGRVRTIRLASSLFVEPSWSPDGRRLAFGGIRKGNTNIFVANSDGSHVRALTHFRSGASQPAWAPNGKDIAFATDDGVELVRVGDARIHLVVAQGFYPSWAPSGRALVFERQLGGQKEALFTIRPDGTGETQLTNLPGQQRSPAWSPDGREIAFDWWTPGGGLSLYLIRPDGTHLRRVTTQVVPDGRPAWSPDGRHLLLLSNAGPTSNPIVVVDVKTGRVTTLPAKIGSYASDPSWSSR